MIHSSTTIPLRKHFYQVWDVLQLYADNGIVINASKFKFCRQTVKFTTCNWTIGSSINTLTNLIIFCCQTAIEYKIHFKYQQIPILITQTFINVSKNKKRSNILLNKVMSNS